MKKSKKKIKRTKSYLTVHTHTHTHTQARTYNLMVLLLPYASDAIQWGRGYRELGKGGGGEQTGEGMWSWAGKA